MGGLFGGGGSSGNTTTVQKADPWSGQQPYLTDLFAQAQNLQNNYSPQYYPNNQVAGLNPDQVYATNTLFNTAANGTDPFNAASQNITAAANGAYTNPTLNDFNSSQGTIQNYLSGNMLSSGNPYFQSMANEVIGQVMPQITGSFTNGGRMDSGLATRAASQGATDALGSIANQDYMQGQQNQLAAAGLAGSNTANAQNNEIKADLIAPSYDAQTMQNLQTALGAGGVYQGQDQNVINAAINAYNYNQMLPYNQLGLYDNFINGSYGGTSTLTQPYYQNQGANALAGAAGGASLGSLLLGPSGLGLMGSGAAGGVGAGLGALLAFL